MVEKKKISDNNHSDIGDLIETGKLIRIKETGIAKGYDHNGIAGPGYHSWPVPIGNYTLLELMIDSQKDLLEYNFPGIISSDSIGHILDIYKDKENFINIKDAALDRLYVGWKKE